MDAAGESTGEESGEVVEPSRFAVCNSCSAGWERKTTLDEDGRRPANGRVVAAESFLSIRAEPTRWLWEGRIPLGTATLLVGREKLGKSTLTVELAARLSRGDLPGHLVGQPAGALILSFEDSAARTIKPRLLAAGADLNYVHRVSASRDGMHDLVSLPDDVERVAELAVEHGARLLIVDPFSASLNGSIDNHRDQDVRRAIAPLVALAERADLAVLALAHWNKASGGDPLSRVLGSRGLTAAVRSVLAFGVAPDAADDSPDRVLAHAASNLGPEAPSLACRIEARVVASDDGEAIPTSRLVIVGESDARAADLLVTRSSTERSEAELAVDWLGDELADGEWHSSCDLKAAANCPERTLQRAAKKLGVEVARRGKPPGAVVTCWRIPLPPESGGTVAPNTATDVGATVVGATVETGIPTEDSAPANVRSRHFRETGATGPSGGAAPAADLPLATPEQEALFARHTGQDDLDDLAPEQPLPDVAADALPAKSCRCDRPLGEPDEDGDLRCARCGHLVEPT